MRKIKTLNSKKKSVYIVCIIIFITMIIISLGLTKKESIKEKEIKRATFVKNTKKGEVYFE